MRTTIKISLIGALFLVLMTCTFGAGFGSAYLLTGSGVLPWPGASESTGIPEPTVGVGEVPSPAPTLTPLPAPTPTDDDKQAFELYWEVWGIVQRDFYGELQ